MQQRILGRTDLRVSAVGFGGSRLGSLVLSQGLRKTDALLHEALDLGITLFDTADIYGGGLSERALGRAFQKRRDSVVILTKAGYLPPSRRALRRMAGPLAAFANPSKPGPSSKTQDFSSDYLVRALESSLRRLNMDYVDIFLLHSLPIDDFGLPDSLDAVERMRAAGKCRAYGFSLAAPPARWPDLSKTGARVIGIPVHPPGSSLEITMGQLLEHGMGALAYRPFGTGAVFSGGPSRALPGQEEGTPAHIALRYALDLPAVASVVIGTSDSRHLAENVQTIGD